MTRTDLGITQVAADALRDAIRNHVPDGYDQVDPGWPGALRRECLEHLDYLVARVEEWEEIAPEELRTPGLFRMYVDALEGRSE